MSVFEQGLSERTPITSETKEKAPLPTSTKPPPPENINAGGKKK